MYKIRQSAHNEVFGNLTPGSSLAGRSPAGSRNQSPFRSRPVVEQPGTSDVLKPDKLDVTTLGSASADDTQNPLSAVNTSASDGVAFELTRFASTGETHAHVPHITVERALVQTTTDPSSAQGSAPMQPGRNNSTRLESFLRIMRTIIFFSWINVLLVMVPVAIAVHFTTTSAVAIFVTSTLAIIPLAALLGFATEELAKRFGPATGALLNVTFGNATELIVFIFGIINGEVGVVQAAIIGSVLSNLLLVLGMAFCIGGFRFKEQYYNNTVSQTTGCCLLLATLSLSMPTAFHASFSDSVQADKQVLKLSYATSIVLLLLYGVYLMFQLRTHTYLYKSVSVGEHVRSNSLSVAEAPTHRSTMDDIETATALSRSPSTIANQLDDQAEDETPQIPVIASVVLLLASTGLVAVCAEFMVSSISDLVATTAISAQFVGLILIPIVGNAAEHLTAVTVAYKDKMDLALGITLGSSLQIVLLVAPISVLLGWGVGQPLTLWFSLFETLAVFATVAIVTYLVIDGRSNYLEGALLMAAYVLIAIASLLYPSASEESGGL
ncbi:Belongs to the Ca(2) cation antiporter (CaCA) (TC 2.A.19) [Savitreella phatthalungensis]